MMSAPLCITTQSTDLRSDRKPVTIRLAALLIPSTDNRKAAALNSMPSPIA